MDNINEALQRVENPPEFANLSYSDQVGIRANVLAPILAQDSGFVGLPPQDKDFIWKNLLYRKPIYKDANYATYTNQLEQKIKAGDKQATIDAMSDVAFQKASDEFAITRFLNSVVTKAVQGLEPYYAKIDPKHALPAPGMDDKRKMADYFDRVLNKERSIVDRASLALKLFPAMKIGATVITGLAGLAPLYAGLVGTLAAPAGLAKLGMVAVDKASLKLVQHGFGMALYKGARVAVHALAGGVVGMLNGGLKEAMSQKWQNLDWIKVQQEAVKSFGPYFIGDLAMFAVGGMVKGMGIGVKKVFSKGFVKEGSKTAREYAEAVTDALSGKIDPVMYNRLTKAQQEVLSKVQRFHGIITHVDKQTPENLLEMVGFANGIKVKIKNNSYEITKLGQTGTKSFKSFKEATEHVYNLLNESPKVKLDPQDLDRKSVV